MSTSLSISDIEKFKSLFATSRSLNVVILAMMSKFVVGEAAAAAVSVRRGSISLWWTESSYGESQAA